MADEPSAELFVTSTDPSARASSPTAKGSARKEYFGST